MRFLDFELARRLELAESEAACQSVKALARLRPESGAAWLGVAGGWAAYAGLDSPLTQIIGAGFAGPVTEEQMAELESFFESRGSAVNLEVCPLADSSLIERLGMRGYRVIEFSNVNVRELRSGEEFDSPPPGVSFRILQPTEGRLWAETVAQGFAEHYPVTPDLLDILEASTARVGAQFYLAEVDGRIAGGAVLTLHEGLAGLFGASTLPEFRRRGVQGALLRERLRVSVEAGCDIALSITQPASASQRNLERLGFRVAYTRAKFTRARP